MRLFGVFLLVLALSQNLVWSILITGAIFFIFRNPNQYKGKTDKKDPYVVPID